MTSALAAALSQLLAIGTGVNRLTGVGVGPHRSAVAVSLLGLKRALHCDAVAAAPERQEAQTGEQRRRRKKGEGGEESTKGGLLTIT